VRLGAVAADVDRTLTNDDLVLDLDAVRVIRLLEGAGVPVILCSGRDVIALGALAQYLGTSGVIVAEDGAILGRFGPTHYRTRLLARPERVHAALAVLEEAFPSQLEVIQVPSRLASFVLSRVLDRAAANRLLAEKGIKAKVVDSSLTFELADGEVDKGSGLVEAAAMLGVDPADVVAVGDSPTDVDMFRVAGWSAAVANAPPEVKAEADYVCTLPHGQGFVEAVRRAVELFRPDLAGLPWPEPGQEAAAGRCGPRRGTAAVGGAGGR